MFQIPVKMVGDATIRYAHTSADVRLDLVEPIAREVLFGEKKIVSYRSVQTISLKSIRDSFGVSPSDNLNLFYLWNYPVYYLLLDKHWIYTDVTNIY